MSDMQIIPFEFKDAVYSDPVYDMEITISGSGSLIFPDKAQVLSEVDVTELSRDISESVVYAINVADIGCSYNMIPYNTEKLIPDLTANLTYNILPSDIEFSSFCPNDESVAAIVRFKRSPRPVPQQTAPQQTVPQQTAPQQTAPQQTTPQQTTPQQTAPQQTAPQQTTPQQTAPQQTAPQQTARPAITAGNKLILVSAGIKKMDVIKYIKDNFGLSLAAAKDIVENSPSVISEYLSVAEFNMHINSLAKLGAEAGVYKNISDIPKPQPRSYSPSAPSPATPSVPSSSSGNKLVLLEAGGNKTAVIKYIKDNFGLDLSTAKNMAEKTPSIITDSLSSIELNTHIKSLARLGAKAERR